MSKKDMYPVMYEGHSDDQIKSIIKCANALRSKYDNVLPNTPLEYYLIGFVYPEVIDKRDSIPEELLINKLKDFKNKLSNNEIRIPGFIKVLNLREQMKEKYEVKNKSREMLTYAKLASECIPYLNDSQLEDFIQCANKFKDTKFECYVMKCVYPEIINMYGNIPYNLVSEKLLEFKNDLINNDVNALKLFVELKNSKLKPSHLAYYCMIKESLNEINPCIRMEAEELLNNKSKQIDNRIKELELELNNASALSKSLSKIITGKYLNEKTPLIEKNYCMNEKELNKLINDIGTISTFKSLMNIQC